MTQPWRLTHLLSCICTYLFFFSLYQSRGSSVTGVADAGAVHLAEVDAAASPDGLYNSELEHKVQMETENRSRSQALCRVN